MHNGKDRHCDDGSGDAGVDDRLLDLVHATGQRLAEVVELIGDLVRHQQTGESEHAAG
ncbi:MULTISPECIES: hypothetical protein [unclassified Micromonospora]|uniref:hypothetical protein n=1 Tax=unclassified Micromonospora TaxID=2617518 RepID=UPI00363CCDA8